MLHAVHLEGYYRLRERIGERPQPARSSGRTYASFDDPTFLARYGRRCEDGLLSVELYLEGVHCAACVWLVERAPAIVPGVVDTRLDLGRSLARITWDPERTPLSAAARFLDAVGYPCHPYRGVDAADLARREERSLLIRTAVAGAVAGNVMLLAFALYGGAFEGPERAYGALFRWASLGLSLPSVLWCASVFYRGAWGSLRARRLHMDVPIAVGILTGFAWGTFNTLRGAGEVYFDSVTALIFLLLVGRMVQRRQQRSATRATELLLSLTPATARLVDGGETREVPIEALGPGALVEVLAGGSVPADGVVVQGSSTVDRSLLTGESRPEPVAPCGIVHAGTVNLASRLLVEVTATGEATRVGQLMQLVEEGAGRRAPVVQAADRISAWFVGAVLVLAAGTAILWLVLDPERAVGNAVALLIVSCPCALGLATPLAVAAAVGSAARRGILIKGGDALEQLARPGRLVLDKTGTLTEGRYTLVRWLGDESIRPLVAAAEAVSAHPAARALSSSLARTGPVEVVEHTGRGVTGTVAGRRVAIGSPRFVAAEIGAPEGIWRDRVETVVSEGLTPIAVAVDGAFAAVAGLGDPLRADTPQALAALAERGFEICVISGDHPDAVAAAARGAGLDPARAAGGMTPEAKLDFVEQAGTRGPVVMVGDGVNDAAALAHATVGIGVHGGAEAALAAADVWLGRPGLAPLVELVDGARRTLAVIHRNLGLSLVYNGIAVSCAVAGLMSPLLAAVLMPLSSMTVVVSSYRARTFSPPGR